MNNTKIDHDNCDAEYFEHNEQEIKDLLLYHKVVNVTEDTITLDNGTELRFVGNEGCCGCQQGWYYLKELNGCDNAITNVEFVTDEDVTDKNNYDKSYKIFVLAEDKRIKLAQIDGIDGYDGNCWYGTGYTVYVKFKH